MGCCASAKAQENDAVDAKEVGTKTDAGTVIAEKIESENKQSPQSTDAFINGTTAEPATEQRSGPVLMTAEEAAAASPSTSEEEDENLPDLDMEQKSDFQVRMEQRRSEKGMEKQRLSKLQVSAFEQQVASQQLNGYRRLYDVWEEFSVDSDGQRTMDIDGLTGALKVFGMVIDINTSQRSHIWDKFDVDNENELTYSDFSATLASFVGSGAHDVDDHALQTIFEIFDCFETGFLEVEQIARILLTQAQLSVVLTGQEKGQIVYSKAQCLKQARRMIEQFDSDEFQDNKISFDEFKNMFHGKTERDMLINSMRVPSVDVM